MVTHGWEIRRQWEIHDLALAKLQALPGGDTDQALRRLRAATARPAAKASRRWSAATARPCR